LLFEQSLIGPAAPIFDGDSRTYHWLGMDALLSTPKTDRGYSRIARPETRNPARQNALRTTQMADDWKKSLPFPAHWASYLAFKLIVLALAALAGLHFLGYL